MFILKRQDVEISNVQHPSRDQQIPILSYQGQTFRLVQVFTASQEDEAKAYWRDLTDNRGKACVLLEEPDRYSVWGKVRLDQITGEPNGVDATPASFVQACLLLLQAVYLDIEDLLGAKQVGLFQKDITDVFSQWKFPKTESANAIKQILESDPLKLSDIPPWQEHHLNKLLEELHRLGKRYFGNANFTERVLEALQDMSASEQGRFIDWLKQSPNGKLWQ